MQIAIAVDSTVVERWCAGRGEKRGLSPPSSSLGRLSGWVFGWAGDSSLSVGWRPSMINRLVVWSVEDDTIRELVDDAVGRFATKKWRS